MSHGKATNIPISSENKTVKNLLVLSRDIVPEIIDSGPMGITDLFQNKTIATSPKILSILLKNFLCYKTAIQVLSDKKKSSLS